VRRISGSPPTISLFAQLLTLTGLTVLAAQATSLLLILGLPPQAPDFYRLTEVEQVLRGETLALGERRPLEVRDVAQPPRSSLEGRLAPLIRTKLAEDLGTPESRIVLGGNPPPFADRRAYRILRQRMRQEGGLSEEHFVIDPFEVAVQQPDGHWRTVRPKPAFGLTPWEQRIGLWFVLSAMAMAPVAYVFARRLARPITLFANAAERLGRDPRAPPLTVSGNSEIATATRAFNDMQCRLQRYVEDRTAMVGAIAHDLRTPLTRLRFRIENVPDDQRAKMAADLDQMEAMITAALAFVRDASRPAQRRPLELSSLLESLCDEMAETGADTHIESHDKVIVEGDPMALRRLFTNLLDNAVKFGGAARVRVWGDGEQALVEIDDDGPGVPEEERERVFEPFYRRDPSRSRKTGGSGLGLAVVRSIARGHGGDVILMNRAGGLTARVLLPI
jgi:signal transduction histidine kinase